MAKDSTAKIWEKLGNELGGDLFFRASEPLKLNWDVIEYPCVSLGSAVGVWGVPTGGKITQFHGSENSGKTFLAMLMAKATLEKYPKSEILWIDAELSFSKKWAAKIGLDPSRVIIVNSNNGAEIFSALCGRYNKKGQKTTPGIFDLVQRGELNIKLVVLDSIAQLVAPAEEGRNFEDVEMSSLARFLPKALRALRPMLAKCGAGMICINQLRETMVQGAQPSYAGGRAYKFNLDFAIKLHPSTKKENILLDANGEKVGHLIIATVEKSRGGVNKHQAEFFLDFTKGVVRQGEELAKLAAAYGVVARPDNTKWVYNGQTTKGKDAFYALLDADAALRSEIFEKIKAQKESGVEVKLEISDEAKEVAGSKAEFADDGEEETSE